MWWTGPSGGLVAAIALLGCSLGCLSANADPFMEFITPTIPAFPGEVDPDRCSGFDQSKFAKGFACGAPLAEPCFDFSRCTTSSGIYVHDAYCSLSNSSALLTADGRGLGAEAEDDHYVGWVFRNAAREAGALAPTYESACIIMHVVKQTTERCPVDSYLWNDGVNHVMVSFGDKGRDGRRDVVDSYAMDASSNMHPCYYRSGYDVSLPLAPKKHLTSLAGIAPSERTFFLTTKGSVYLTRHGSEERMSVVPLHDEAHGVIMSMHCFELHDEHLLPENVEYCEALKERYDDYDYESLMDTTFALIPAGRSPGTYRLAEAMGAGAIPVIVARDMVLPFREHFDWPSFSFWFTPDQVESELMATLRAVPQSQLEEMQHKSLEAYREMFGDDDTPTDGAAYEPIAKRLVDILVKRVQHRGGRALTAPTKH